MQRSDSSIRWSNARFNFSNTGATPVQFAKQHEPANLAPALHTLPPFRAIMKLKEIQRTQPRSADFAGKN
jgi:hypothetical protein